MMRRETVAGIVLGLLMLPAVILAGQSPAHAAPAASWRQPYGGCVEAWQAPHSPGARACHRHGWTVRRWLIVGPAGYVRYLSGARHICRTEDSRSCVWFATAQGNGRGRSFWTDRHGRVHYLSRETPARGVWI